MLALALSTHFISAEMGMEMRGELDWEIRRRSLKGCIVKRRERHIERGKDRDRERGREREGEGGRIKTEKEKKRKVK